MNLRSIECVCPIYIEEKGDCSIIIDRGEICIIGKPISSTMKELLKKRKKKKEKKKKRSEFDKYLVKTIYLGDEKRKREEEQKRKASPKKYTDMFVKPTNTAPVVHNGDVFIKVKVRKPKVKNDSSYGYINMNKIDKLKVKNNIPFIILESGHSIKINSSFNILYKNILMGRSLNFVVSYVFIDETDYESEDLIKTYRDYFIMKYGSNKVYLSKDKLRKMVE